VKNLTILILGLVITTGCSTSHYPPKQRAQSTPAEPQYFYIQREVRTPGRFNWKDGMTLQDAIETAGGFTDFARGTTRITHHDGSIERVKMGPQQKLTRNPTLLPEDRIYVMSPYL
jgi:protein involved in polysaccharide export with SLBB domain